MTESTTDRLHAAIMNIPCNVPRWIDSKTAPAAFMEGHKAARHAAAELVAAADSQDAPMLWLGQVREDFRRLADEADRALAQHAKRMLGGCDEGAESGWRELTDEDRDEAFASMPNMLDGFMKLWGWLHFAKAIEAKCREKNAAHPSRLSAEQAQESKGTDGGSHA
jgi:hypothetical protein